MPFFTAPRIFAAVSQVSRSRAVGAMAGGAVGALLGVSAASHGQIAAPVVLIVTICGAILGYADACWREPPRRPFL